ncbi:TetR/AcrR family transcriptional regulator [Gordonia sp. (in: high G+C Gram-positive bacteria)]|uniref:TetR/AcrR family transcriptional regulator n=1 Tax=Gordonia sp. (in: high G+C Gram-positive bacteria) TaxID=84139 RepID=UPI00169D68C1|nr:TetR/AcrR family transcriptional regulator [Gordonia sp. (in: high G+C Gram-positive bacteria)]NLG45425.1 TetR/AcrR family transcriptional regulator [Gordonia sp. (in: high G+C Gram-positive bacteria)]
MTMRSGRTYGGVTAAERQTLRRKLLVKAGLELFGTEGFLNASVKKICDEAGLTQRYFYESFPDRVALLAAVYEYCVEEARNDAIIGAAEVLERAGVAGPEIPPTVIPELAKEALGGFIKNVVDDPRRARIIFIEVVGVAPEIEKLRLRAIHDWADLIGGFAGSGKPMTQAQKLGSIGLVGALTQLLVDWQMAQTDPVSDDLGPAFFQMDAIHEVVTEMFVATYERIFRP